MKNVLIILTIIFCSCSAGKKYCAPGNIKSGKSSQHLDSKKFRAMIRIKWTNQTGPFCKVRYQNMKQTIDRLYYGCKCTEFKVGSWVSIDSI